MAKSVPFGPYRFLAATAESPFPCCFAGEANDASTVFFPDELGGKEQSVALCFLPKLSLQWHFFLVSNWGSEIEASLQMSLASQTDAMAEVTFSPTIFSL